LYLGVLMYPCTRFFSIRFTTTMAGCAVVCVDPDGFVQVHLLLA
jgi:hypothetical protein